MHRFSLEVCVEYRDEYEEPNGPCLGCGHLPEEHPGAFDGPAFDDAGYDVSPIAVLAVLRRGAPVEEQRRAS
ncbi:MAG: hypothetical protein JWL73_3454 [Actinomycetia bacterium]|nr:hypothetical protein [Actinomycetes bacterium]